MDLYPVVKLRNKDGDNYMKHNAVGANKLDDIFKSYKLSDQDASKIQDTIHIGTTIDYIQYWKYLNIPSDVYLNNL